MNIIKRILIALDACQISKTKKLIEIRKRTPLLKCKKKLLRIHVDKKIYQNVLQSTQIALLS